MQEVTEWVLHPRESDHVECGGVYISANPITLSAEEFISSTLNIGVKNNKNPIEIKFFIKKSNPNQIEKNSQSSPHYTHVFNHSTM